MQSHIRRRHIRLTGDPVISKVDYIAVPSEDVERSRSFYVETLGLRPDDHAHSEVWAGETCLSIWEPSKFGMEFSPQKNAHIALHDDLMLHRRYAPPS
jgi:catechol 2,3-dioxygenase-like lactoylglutathione lyase family enzyme